MPYAKRVIVAGFPKEFVFECRADVDAYLSGDRVTCLLCGMKFRILDTHLRKVHEISSDDYRERYGLPYCRGLCGSSFSERRSENSRAMYRDNIERQSAALEAAHAVQAEYGNPQRKKPRFFSVERTRFTEADFYEFGRRVISGRTGMEVETDPDMPTKAHVFWFKKRSPKFAQFWNEQVYPAAPSGFKKADRAANVG